MISTRLATVLLFAAAATPALAQDVQYELVNNSGLTLMEFHTSPAGEGGGGDDLLGAQVIAAGTSGTVTIAEGSATCDYDFRFIFEDGSEMTDTVNICDLASYELVP